MTTTSATAAFSRQRRRLAIGLVSLAAVTGAVVNADAVGARDKAADTEESTKADVELIAETFGWKVGDTADHMQAQAGFGELINTVSSKYGESFAGAAFAEEPGAASQLFVKGDVPRDVAALVDRSGLKIEIIDGQKYSERELDERAGALTKLLAEVHPEVSAAVMADGQILLAVPGELKAELPKDLLDGVKIAEGPERLSNLEVDIEGGRRVYATSGGSCTSGFSVRRISDGTTGIATAAHCTGINRIAVPGPDVALSHRAEHLGFFGDVEWKTSAEPEVDNYWASPTQLRDVSMVWPAGSFATNMVTCVHSRVQGTRSCDRIYSTSVSSTVNGRTASNLVATDNDNTVPGDSGGPWSFSTIADGIHRGDKWIWFGTRNVFSKADLLPAALGVEVMT